MTLMNCEIMITRIPTSTRKRKQNQDDNQILIRKEFQLHLHQGKLWSRQIEASMVNQIYPYRVIEFVELLIKTQKMKICSRLTASMSSYFREVKDEGEQSLEGTKNCYASQPYPSQLMLQWVFWRVICSFLFGIKV